MIREFTRDDWYAFAGAEEFRDGAPLIYESELGQFDFYAVADVTGIEFHLLDNSKQPLDRAYKVRSITKSQAKQKALLESLLQELGLYEDDVTGESVGEKMDSMEGFEYV